MLSIAFGLLLFKTLYATLVVMILLLTISFFAGAND
jgi:hypothetical protein